MKVLLVDDEPIVRRDLERLLKVEDGVAVVGSAANGREALEQIDLLGPDVVLLDVEMPELDGFGVVQALDPATGPLIVFVTAHDHYALAAFDANAVDYLLKPFDAERLRTALGRVRKRINGSGSGKMRAVQTAARLVQPYLERLAVKVTDRAIVIPVGEVRRIEASGNYARLHLAEVSYLTRRTMNDLQESLDPARFVRIHRSHIVQLAMIREVRLLGDGDAQVSLAGGGVFTVTRKYRQELEARLGGIA